MLDQYLISQAMLQSITFLMWIFVGSLSLICLGGLGLLIFRGRKGFSRAISKIFIGIGAIVFLGALAIVGLSHVPIWATRYEWNVDLSSEAKLGLFQQEKCGVWKIGETSHLDCIYEGDIHLRVLFAHNRMFEDEGYVLWASGKENKLSSLHLFLRPMSAQEVEAKLVPLVDQWRLNKMTLEEWRSLAKDAQGALSRYFTPPESERESPWLELSLRRLEPARDALRPWIMTLKWHWKED